MKKKCNQRAFPKMVMVLLLCFTASQAFARKWTCDATIFVTGTNQQYTPPPWEMKTGDKHVAGLPGDREKSCKNYIKSVFVNGGLWGHFSFNSSEQDRICKNDSANLRIEYGFDRRPKGWQFTQSISAPPCNCKSKCKEGYSLDENSLPGNPRCVRKLCENIDIPDRRFGPHDDGVGIFQGGLYHHQPVESRVCRFGSEPGDGQPVWTSWLDRDNQGGVGDFEGLSDFLKEGKACRKPLGIECRTVKDGKDWREVGQVYTCTPGTGGVCRNADQRSGSRCLDYEVRFLCPK